MGKQDDKFTFEGVVTEALPNAMFKVQLPNEQKTQVLAYVSGKMRMNYIRILPGDQVTVEISPYDLTKARITFRHSGGGGGGGPPGGGYGGAPGGGGGYQGNRR